MITLQVKKRAPTERPTAVRNAGMVPAVFYGRKEKSTPISVPLADFMKAWKAAGESSIVAIQEEGGEEHQALIQDVSKDPLTNVPIHADFYVVEKDKKLKVKVAIEFSGSAPAVKDLGGILVKVLHELEIQALPKDLPHGISVDVSSLAELKSQILAKDVALPTGVELITDASDVVAAIAEVKEEEEKPVEAIDLSSIEVEKKGKEAKEGEEGTETPEVTPKSEGTKK